MVGGENKKKRELQTIHLKQAADHDRRTKYYRWSSGEPNITDGVIGASLRLAEYKCLNVMNRII